MPYRLILTNDDILQDIEDFKKRIRVAEDRLAALPEGSLPYREHKSREAARHVLKNEVAHVKRLIHIATEALEDV